MIERDRFITIETTTPERARSFVGKRAGDVDDLGSVGDGMRLYRVHIIPAWLAKEYDGRCPDCRDHERSCQCFAGSDDDG